MEDKNMEKSLKWFAVNATDEQRKLAKTLTKGPRILYILAVYSYAESEKMKISAKAEMLA